MVRAYATPWVFLEFFWPVFACPKVLLVWILQPNSSMQDFIALTNLGVISQSPYSCQLFVYVLHWTINKLPRRASLRPCKAGSFSIKNSFAIENRLRRQGNRGICRINSFQIGLVNLSRIINIKNAIADNWKIKPLSKNPMFRWIGRSFWQSSFSKQVRFCWKILNRCFK